MKSTEAYLMWRMIATSVFASYSVSLRTKYTVHELTSNQNLRDAIRDTWYGMYQYMRVNDVDRMSEVASTVEDMVILSAELVAYLRVFIQGLYDDGERDMEVGIDPAVAEEETRTILNLRDIIAGNTFLPEFGPRP